MPNVASFARTFGIRSRRRIGPELAIVDYEIGHYPIARGIYEYPIMIRVRTTEAATLARDRLVAFLQTSGGLIGRVVHTGYGNPYTLTVGDLQVESVAEDIVTLRSTGKGTRRYDMPKQPPVADVPIPPGLSRLSLGLRPVQGLGPDGVVGRHSPSCVLMIDGRYHVWYARSDLSANTSEIWLATSPDGWNWKECGEVFQPTGRGCPNPGAPCVLAHENSYYLFFSHGEGERCLSVSAADHPEGPFSQIGSGPILQPSGDDPSFDSRLVDDPCVIHRPGRKEGEFWLYFKGSHRRLDDGETRIGVAMARKPTGPYKKRRSPLMTARTTCLWRYADGVAMIGDSHPHSLQYSPDGLHFHRVADLGQPIDDAGIFRSRSVETPWALTTVQGGENTTYLSAVVSNP